MGFKVAALQFAVITFGLLFGMVGAANARTIQLVGLGDSLMAGYQLPPGDGFPAKLEAALKAKGLDVAVPVFPATRPLVGFPGSTGPCLTARMA